MKALPAIFLVIPALSLAWAGVDNALGVLGTDVREVWSGGHWKIQDAEGYYRFVVVGGGYEHYKTRLYVQWIRHGSDMELPVIQKTTGIDELHENPVYAFGIPECMGGWECSEVELDAAQAYEHTTHKFNMRFRGVGRYEFRQVF